MFIEYETPEQAAAAIKTKEGYALDKSHKLRVNRFTDVEKYTNMSDTYVEPEVDRYVRKEHLRSWLKDPQARDQFFLYRDNELSVCYNRKKEAPEVVKARTVPILLGKNVADYRTGPKRPSCGRLWEPTSPHFTARESNSGAAPPGTACNVSPTV